MITKLAHYIFLWLASRLYDVVLVHSPEQDITAIHFARSVRDLNISMRTYVEWLDDDGVVQTTSTDTRH
jgi:hypothetical protein